MEKFDFQICGVGLEFLADNPLAVEGDMALFAGDRSVPDISIECRTVAELADIGGELLMREAERFLCRRDRQIFRYRTTNLSAPPYACAAYDLKAPQAVRLTVREADWSWSTGHMRLWSTLCLPQLLLPFRTLIFHASYIGHDGRAILFTAPSQTGKSTQAELWRVHRGAQVINGDKAGVRLAGPPMAHGVPFSGTSGICHNISLPLEAVVVLSQAPVNTVRRLSPSEAVAALCGNVFVDHYIPEEWQLALSLLLDLVAAVPVYALACTPDVRAVEALEQAMARERREKSPRKEAAP